MNVEEYFLWKNDLQKSRVPNDEFGKKYWFKSTPNKVFQFILWKLENGSERYFSIDYFFQSFHIIRRLVDRLKYILKILFVIWGIYLCITNGRVNFPLYIYNNTSLWWYRHKIQQKNILKENINMKYISFQFELYRSFDRIVHDDSSWTNTMKFQILFNRHRQQDIRADID